MTTTEQPLVVVLEDGEPVAFIIDDDARAAVLAHGEGVALALARVGLSCSGALSAAVLAMRAAEIDFGNAAGAATRIIEQFPTCEPVTIPRERAPRRLPGPVPERIVRRAMRGRGWQR